MWGKHYMIMNMYLMFMSNFISPPKSIAYNIMVNLSRFGVIFVFYHRCNALVQTKQNNFTAIIFFFLEAFKEIKFDNEKKIMFFFIKT